MAELIRDSNLSSLRSKGSKQIIAEFLARGKSQGEVEIPATGRGSDSVYASLGLYLKRHPELNMRVKQRADRVYLFQDLPEASNDGNISA